jgi:hypothetical protein
VKKEIIDLAKQYSTDMNGKTILNCNFTCGDMALRIDNINEKDVYVCARIDGTEWKFDFFRQACVFHFITTQVGSQEDETLNEYYETIKYTVGSKSKQEIQLQQKLL